MPPEGFTSLGPRPVQADATYPAGIAVVDVVAVESEGGERFGLRGSCCCAELPWTAPVQHRRPGKIGVGQLIDKERGESPAHAYLRLKNWSRTKEDLQRWLRQVRASHGDGLALIFRDTTDYGIPWELFWLHDDADGGDWLGSLSTVTRWAAGWNQHGKGPVSAEVAQGDVMAYVAAGEMRADLSVLEGLGASLTPTLWDLLKHLAQPGPPLSLVYAACHGTFGELSTQFVLDDGVSVADVDSARLLRLADEGGLVFINACHSGRLIDDQEYNDATQRGFAEAFLRAGAHGFIGPLGKVGEKQARRYLEELVEKLRTRPGTPIAVLIRDLRREYSVRDSPRSNDAVAARALLPFFYTFMYAYYGSPKDLVSLPESAS